jgi:hypothetical protein
VTVLNPDAETAVNGIRAMTTSTSRPSGVASTLEDHWCPSLSMPVTEAIVILGYD